VKPSQVFNQNLRNLFEGYKTKGGTQVLLAEAAGVNQSQISAWLKGTMPSLDQLPGLARALGVSIDMMFEEKPTSSVVRDIVALLPALNEHQLRDALRFIRVRAGLDLPEIGAGHKLENKKNSG
jgi:transcriptional regulator with XRE-family HTH domain